MADRLGQVIVASIGSASNQRINLRWHGKLLTAPRLLICTDADDAGEKAAREIAKASRAARMVQIPMGKDMNEFCRLVRSPVAYNWLMSQLEHE